MFFSRCVNWNILGPKTFFWGGGTKTFLGGQRPFLGGQRPFYDIDTSIHQQIYRIYFRKSRRKEHVASLMTAACKKKKKKKKKKKETKQNKRKQNKNKNKNKNKKQTKTKQTYLLNWVGVEKHITFIKR